MEARGERGGGSIKLHSESDSQRREECVSARGAETEREDEDRKPAAHSLQHTHFLSAGLWPRVGGRSARTRTRTRTLHSLLFK